MALGHRYELVKENGEGADLKDEPQTLRPTSTPIILSWWKLVLYHLLAAGVGALIMFFIARGTFASHPKSTTPTTTTEVPTSTPSTANLAISTAGLEHLEKGTGDPDGLGDKILDCGGNPEEAREKGCVYDVMMQDWVPEPCYDSVLTEKYLEMGNWTWYTAGDGSSTISLEEMRKGEHGSAWMATSYHKEHCVFSWLKIVRALRNNRGISQELMSYDHVLHCAHGALKADSNDQGLGVRAPTNYAKCALYDTWLQDMIPDKHDSHDK